MRRNCLRVAPIVAIAGVLSLLWVVAALAAQPTPGKAYSGPTTATYHGHTATVSFKVSSDGKHLLGFRWAGGACEGLGGGGNPYLNSYLNYPLGTIPVSSTGTFSIANVKVTNDGTPTKTVTSTVSGRFTSATTATGTIHYTSKSIQWHCSGTQTFTAKSH